VAVHARAVLDRRIHLWFHATCYNVSQDSYEPYKKPTSEDLRRFADATRPVYKCQHDECGEFASVMEGLYVESIGRTGIMISLKSLQGLCTSKMALSMDEIVLSHPK
jgi:hypothetical protein